MRKILKKQKGITLVALVITIIILIILAGISISALTNTGLFGKAKEAKERTKKTEKEQEEVLNEYKKELNKYAAQELTKDKINTVLSQTENIILKDANGNIFTVPAGFKITNDATTVDQGIVIEDATSGATAGSQFVWVPVGTITKADGTKTTITLGRYDFDKTTGEESTYLGSYVEEDKNDKTTLKNYGNTIAKNITSFKNSVLANGGYYIGRYEARTTKARTSKDDELTQVTEKGTDQIYNYVTQPQAAQQAQDMYDNANTFTSDLMNSYAWDTAITFIQKCTNQTNYANQSSLNTSLLQTGTNTLADTSKIDKQCNIFDMASNLVEWTTETSNDYNKPCIGRGGDFNYSYFYTSYSDLNAVLGKYFSAGFRPLLYLKN